MAEGHKQEIINMNVSTLSFFDNRLLPKVILKELEHKSCVAEEDLSELKSDMEAVRMNLILSNGRVKKNSDSLKELQEVVDGLKGGSP